MQRYRFPSACGNSAKKSWFRKLMAWAMLLSLNSCERVDPRHKYSFLLNGITVSFTPVILPLIRNKSFLEQYSSHPHSPSRLLVGTMKGASRAYTDSALVRQTSRFGL